MKNIIILFLVIKAIAISQSGFSQGWMAEVDVDLNHELYAYETIENATLTFSGVTVTGASTRSNIHFVLKGTGLPSGDIDLSVTGTGFEPYDPNDPYSQPLYGQLSGNYKTPCTTGFLKSDNPVTHQQVSMWITFYPRLEINDFVQNCDKLTLTATTCYPNLFWEVGEELSGNFLMLPGRTGASMSITREELAEMGFNSAYGRKYFRVTGIVGTTSQLQAVDIYYPGPQAIITSTAPGCHNGSDGSIQIEILSPDEAVINDYVITLHEAIPPEGAIRQTYVNDGVTMMFADIAAGNYWIRIENNSNEIYGSCWTDFTLDPIINPAPVTITAFESSDYNGYPLKCYESKEGTLKANPSGGTGSYSSFEWMPRVSTTDFADSLSEGTYTVKVQDSNGCWSSVYRQTLTAPQELSINLISSGGKNGFDVSCYDKQDGTLTTQVDGGVPRYSYLWSDGTNANSLNNIGTGNYEVWLTDGNGCTATQSVKLGAPEPIAFQIAEVAAINCAGDNSGILEAQSITNTIGDVYYSWSTGEPGREIRNIPAGTYVLTVSDDQGCSVARSHTLKEPLPYTLDLFASSDFNGSTIRCHGEASGELTSIVRDDGGNLTTADHYTWYKNSAEWISGPGMSKAAQATSGTYLLKIVYKTSCSAEATFVLADPPPVLTEIEVISNYNGWPISCSGKEDGSIKAIASGGTGANFTFTWEGGQLGPALNDIGAGPYLVTARDINGCMGTVAKTIKSPAPVEAAISVLSNYNGQPISCFEASDARLRASSRGGTLPYTYSWNSGHTTDELADVAAGHYSLTISDANGCSGLTDTTLVNPDPVKALIVDISNYNGYGVTCHNSADGFVRADASGGTGEYEFAWRESVHTLPAYNHLAPGNYSVTVTDLNGCGDTAEAIITEPESLSLQVTAIKNISCHGGDDGEIEVFATGGANAYEYSIADNQWQASALIQHLKALAYQTTVRDGNGCSKTTTQSLIEPTALVIRFEDIQPALCGDARGSVSAIVIGGTGGYQYTWRNPEGQNLSDKSSLSGLSAGIYTLEVFDEHHCQSSESIGITSTDGPKALVSDVVAPTCSYSLDGSALVEVTQGAGPFLFKWENGQNTNKGTNLGRGNHFVNITDSSNCTIVESVFITAPDSLITELVEKTEPLCFGECNGRLTVSASGGNGNYHYAWDGFTGPEAINLCSGTFEVNVNDDQGCVSSLTLDLGQPKALLIKLISAKSPACADGCDGIIEVLASGGTGDIQYSWSTGENSPAINNLCAGSYTMIASDAHNCRQTETFAIEDPAEIRLDLGGTITLCAGQTHTMDAGNQWQSFSWTSDTGFKSSSQQVTIAEAGEYWLDAVSAKDCIVQDTFLLETSLDLLKANFLLTTEAMPGDTVVMIDISWPLPDNIIWSLPQEMIHLKDQGDIVHGKFDHAGSYNVSLLATLGACRDDITKAITIHDGDGVIEEGRLGHESFVKNFSLYPNPNDGVFDVEVEFLEESPILLTVWNTLTATKVGHIEDNGQIKYLKHVDLRPLSAGPYTLRLDHSKGARYLKFIVR